MNNIKQWRKKVGITQSELADKCGWFSSQSRISNYELGLREPSIKECRIIVAALKSHGADCDIDNVFPDEINDIKKVA